MRVRVLDVQQSDGAVCEVRFASAYGEAVGQWRSPSAVIGGEYDIEMDVPEPLMWGRTAVIASQNAQSIAIDQAGVRICAILDAIHQDGTVALRVGDALIMAESEGDAPPVGSTVCLTLKYIDLYAHDRM